jgi:hypothetical protein
MTPALAEGTRRPDVKRAAPGRAALEPLAGRPSTKRAFERTSSMILVLMHRWAFSGRGAGGAVEAPFDDRK